MSLVFETPGASLLCRRTWATNPSSLSAKAGMIQSQLGQAKCKVKHSSFSESNLQWCFASLRIGFAAAKLKIVAAFT